VTQQAGNGLTEISSTNYADDLLMWYCHSPEDKKMFACRILAGFKKKNR
jgi:hypothetical protein